MKVNKWNEKGKDDENKKNLKIKKERQNKINQELTALPKLFTLFWIN
jgi:hypothetical protein